MWFSHLFLKTMKSAWLYKHRPPPRSSPKRSWSWRCFFANEVRISYVPVFDFELDFFHVWMWSYNYFDKNWSSNYAGVPKPTKGETFCWCVLAWVSWRPVELADLSSLGNFVKSLKSLKTSFIARAVFLSCHPIRFCFLPILLKM